MADDATMRLYVADFESCLSAIGLVKVPCTGQYDLATGTRPASGTTVVTHWSVWRFDDALQTTEPIFIKFHWQQPAANVGVGVLVSVGTAVDTGTGAIGNAAGASSMAAVTNRLLTWTATTNFRVQYHFASDNGEIAIGSFSGDLGRSLLHIARPKRLDNTVIGTSFIWHGLVSNVNPNSYGSAYYFYNRKALVETGSANMFGGAAESFGGINNNTTYPMIDNEVYLWPVGTGVSGTIIGAPSRILVTAPAGSVSSGAFFQAPHYGETCTFRASNVNSYTYMGTGNNYWPSAIRTA
jgi:hypothetical protein